MTNNKLAWKIFETLLAKGCEIGNASVPIIERLLDEAALEAAGVPAMAERIEQLEAELATFREVEMREVDDYQKVIAELDMDTKRLQFLITESGMDGFDDHDAIDFIETVMTERGHDEPTPEDEFDGWRRMLDAAMKCAKSAGGE